LDILNVVQGLSENEPNALLSYAAFGSQNPDDGHFDSTISNSRLRMWLNTNPCEQQKEICILPTSKETLVNTHTANHQLFPQITALSDGGWVITYPINIFH
jgi:hypothetical protein